MHLFCLNLFYPISKYLNFILEKFNFIRQKYTHIYLLLTLTFIFILTYIVNPHNLSKKYSFKTHASELIF